MAGLGLVAATVVPAALLIYGARARSAQIFGASSHCGSKDRRSVALTFDDGPSQGSALLIDYLEREGVKATFFQCGANVARHPVLAREIYSRGHEIGNHTFSHPRLCPRLGWQMNLRSPHFIYQEFADAQAIIHSETGATPRLLRAPYGLRWFGVGLAQRRLSLHGVMWSVIGNDWKWPTRKITEFVVRKSKPGAILCLHDGRETRAQPAIQETLAAVREIVPRLKDLGYSFKTASDLLTE